MVIDPETAPVVHDIFTWRAEHVGYTMIARRLNEQKVPTPSMIHHLRGEFDKMPLNAPNIWQSQMIKSITNHMVYAGHMAQAEASKNTMLRSGLFEDYNDKLLTEDEYWDAKQKFDDEANRLEF